MTDKELFIEMLIKQEEEIRIVDKNRINTLNLLIFLVIIPLVIVVFIFNTFGRDKPIPIAPSP